MNDLLIHKFLSLELENFTGENTVPFLSHLSEEALTKASSLVLILTLTKL